MDFETHCIECGTPLKGRQVRTCSTRCRVADYRRSRRQGPKLRTCRLCGQPFTPVNSRQRMCRFGIDNMPGDPCYEAQDAADEHEEFVVQAWREVRDSLLCEGPDCTAHIPYSGRGRPKRFCSARCRVAASRAAKKRGARK